MSVSSNIRVFVHWAEQTVFAGETIECQITFKNVANVPSTPKNNLNSLGAVQSPATERQRKSSPLHTITSPARTTTAQSSRPPPVTRGHRSTLSLNVPSADLRTQRGATSWKESRGSTGGEDRGHRRSVSIMSIGQSDTINDDTASQSSLGTGSRRPSRGHARSASLQIIPRRSNANGSGPTSAPLAHRSATHPSPLFHTFSPPEFAKAFPDQISTENITTSAPNTPGVSNITSTRRKSSSAFGQNFKFPPVEAAQYDQTSSELGAMPPFIISPTTAILSEKNLPSRSKEEIPVILERIAPSTKVLSPTVNGETPRSSGEFYSLSNNSTETLASEYLPQQPGRIQPRGAHTRRISTVPAVTHHRLPETLMMGYAQISGSFTLDGSLINQAPFEEVKRKGVVGGQGGGVIGVERSKRDSGLLRGFGWGNIGESLSGLLNGGELSSIKEMRGTAGSKSIPLLSTPQSILFVDLRLAPGESRTYEYSFKLPRGLPPTHRGKAIKISYDLVIGTQRPGGAKEQQVKSVEIPFRVLGSVNGYGELLGHDLMAPYIILRDQARVHSLDSTTLVSPTEPRNQKSKDAKSPSTLEDFLAYVDELITRPRQNSSLGLLSPTEASGSRRASGIEEPASAKEAIDMAIMRSNLVNDQQQSSNRFEIARNGQRVAVVMLARPAYRLGETITVAIDFTDAQISCYAIHAALESSENIDSGIALRSESSIHRVTRKSYSTHSESTLFARRVMFSPTVPVTATPTFYTSGVSLEWKILIEFVTPRLQSAEDGAMTPSTELLEEVSRDERSVILAAAERIDCESFEIAVPLRVYGALGNSDREDNMDGLVV